MNKDELLEAIKRAKASKKRNFTQSLDFIVSFRDIDLKKTDQQFEAFAKLPHDTGSEKKVCCILGPELMPQKDMCDHVVEVAAMERMQKKEIKKLAKQYDYFVAQGNFMAQVAKNVGRYLGPRNKMPNPKAGCVVPPTANLAMLKENLKRTVRIGVKAVPLFQCKVGNQDSKDEHVIENIMTIYNQITHHLPSEAQNIKDVFVKLTMGPAIKVGSTEDPAAKPTESKVKSPESKPAESKPSESKPAESAA